MTQSYCTAVKNFEKKQSAYATLHRSHHDTVHGRMPNNDAEWLARLVLEIHQAGLNWGLILTKEAAIRNAFSGFNPKKVAHYSERTVQDMLQNTHLIRSEKKIRAVIKNANAVLALAKSHGSFGRWLLAQPKQPLPQWTKKLRTHFSFVGPEIASEFLIGTGILPGAHHGRCPLATEVKTYNQKQRKNYTKV